MSKKMVTLIGKSIILLTNAVNETVRYLEQYGLDTNVVAVEQDDKGKYFACIVYECNELDRYLRYSVYELDYSDIRESKPSNYKDFVDPEYSEEDAAVLKEKIDRENRDMEGRNETGKVINSLAKELIAPTGDSIDLAEDLMNKNGGTGLYKKPNINPGRPNMSPRRPGMKWDI